MCYNIFMRQEYTVVYRYRKWPIFLPLYLGVSTLYFFIFYSVSDFSYRNLAEAWVITIFLLGPPALSFFYLRIVKLTAYRELGLNLLYNFFLSALAIYLLMLTYLSGEEWLGALAWFFFLFIYNLLAFPLSYLFFRLSRRKATNNPDA